LEDAQRGRSSAYGKLMSLAEELRKSDSSLSVAQSFEKVYSDPANLDDVQNLSHN
jgi:hypothetical protein